MKWNSFKFHFELVLTLDFADTKHFQVHFQFTKQGLVTLKDCFWETFGYHHSAEEIVLSTFAFHVK